MARKKWRSLTHNPCDPEIVERFKRLVANSSDAHSDLAKKAIIRLIDLSQGFSRTVTLDLPNSEAGKSIAYSVHDMNACGGTTHLSEILQEAGLRDIFLHGWSDKHGYRISIGSFDNDENYGRTQDRHTLHLTHVQQIDLTPYLTPQSTA